MKQGEAVHVTGLPAPSRTVTVTGPATWAGVTAVRFPPTFATEVAETPPNKTVHGPLPIPLTEMVTDVPPVVGPEFGETLVTDNASLNAVCAVNPEVWPIAVRVKILSRSIC